MSADTVTIVRARNGVLTKQLQLTAAGWTVIPFSGSRWYGVTELPVGSFAELAHTLASLTGDPAAAVVRGAPLPGVERRRCRRLVHRCRETGDEPTFGPAARRWLGIDVDSLPEPAGDDFTRDPEAGVEHAIGKLPEPFWDASCWWQATGSAGIKPGIRCRLWFWLSRAVDDAEAKGWLARSPADRVIYQPVGLHYTADPILPPGVADPMARRSGIRQGLDDMVGVPAQLPRLETLKPLDVALDGHELTDDDLVALAEALEWAPLAIDVWERLRVYSDRSTGHFAVAAALARAGLRDGEALRHALIAIDVRLGHDTSKILRIDYAERTIGAALAETPASAR